MGLVAHCCHCSLPTDLKEFTLNFRPQILISNRFHITSVRLKDHTCLCSLPEQIHTYISHSRKNLIMSHRNVKYFKVKYIFFWRSDMAYYFPQKLWKKVMKQTNTNHTFLIFWISACTEQFFPPSKVNLLSRRVWAFAASCCSPPGPLPSLRASPALFPTAERSRTRPQRREANYLQALPYKKKFTLT